MRAFLEEVFMSLLLLKSLLGLLRVVTDTTICENAIRLLKVD